MRDLRLKLDDTDFARLVETARSLIPTLAPAWTDHNIHDPGITLLDLTSATAEAQIYSLARMRRDERSAYAALVGVFATGPSAATGLIWPRLAQSALGGGLGLAAGTLIGSTRHNTPDVSLQAATFLTGAKLARLTAKLADGTSRDWTRSNQQEAASFAAFGNTDTAAAVLTLEFSGPLAGPGVAIPAGYALALGVRIAGSPGGNETLSPISVRATLRQGRSRQALPLILDTTDGLLHTGVLLLDLSDVAMSSADFSITLRSRGGDFVRAPQLVRIAPNVLLVEGRQQVSDEDEGWGTGLPNQQFALRQPGLQFGPDIAPPRVSIATAAAGFEEWQAVADLSAAGPDDAVYFLDCTRAVLVFGNGINGVVPPSGATLRVDYWVASGALGNVPRGVQWQLPELPGVFGANAEPLAGGADATTLEDLQRTARARIRTEFPLVTVTDLEQAALALPDLQVVRARELPDLGARCGFPELAGVRTLVVLAAGSTLAQEAASENESWLHEVQRRLALRLPLAQRLNVMAPKYLPIRVRTTLQTRPQTDPEQLRLSIESELRRRFVLIGNGAWPFERDVKRLDIRGWLRKLPGVASIEMLELLLNDRRIDGDSIAVHGRALPLLLLSPGDVTVQRASVAVRP